MSQIQREPYTADDKAKVADLMRAGLSASQIGEQVGRSKNSVVSFVHRHEDLLGIGLKGEPWRGGSKARNAPPAEPKPHAMSIKASRKQGGIKGGKPAKILPQNLVAKKAARAKDPVFVERAVPLPVLRMVKLVDLQPGECRYPHGDPRSEDFGFCGAPVRSGSWCRHHRRLGYTPAIVRRAAA